MTGKYNLLARIAAGLSHYGIKKCSDWAMKYRIMGAPFYGEWSFDYHSWLKEPMDNPSHKIVCKKAAQMGFTEVALNRAFYYIDILNVSVLYLLPSKIPDASDFSVDRFDKALDLSQHISDMFSNTKNVGLKKAGTNVFYLRGTNSRSQLKSIPVSFIIFDELDEMKRENITLAIERQSGQLIKYLFYISTPTIEEHGIDAEFKLSDQRKYFFKCPHCGVRQTLDFPDSIIIPVDTSTDPNILKTHLICKHCKKELKHEEKRNWLSLDNCEWVPEYPDRLSSGYTINQLYSSVLHPSAIADLYLQSRNNPTKEQEFYNSKLGQTHIVKGAKIYPSDVEHCKGHHRKIERRRNNNLITMGIDVGSVLTVIIEEWYLDPRTKKSLDPNLAYFPVIVNELEVKSFDQLDSLMEMYSVNFAVIDFQPETRKATEFARRHYGRVAMCRYGNVRGKEISRREDELTVDVHRTTWLDLSLSRFINGNIKVPQNVSSEFVRQLGNTVRIYKTDRNDNPIGVWVKVGDGADHFAHSRNYSEIALKLSVSKMKVKDINDY